MGDAGASSASDGAPDGFKYASVIVVGLGILSSLASNVLFGVGIGNVSCMYRVKYSPSAPAFQIWLPIYILGLLVVADQLNALSQTTTRHAYSDTASNFFYGFAWLCAAAWTPAFTKTIEPKADSEGRSDKDDAKSATQALTTINLKQNDASTESIPDPLGLLVAAVFLTLTALLSMLATLTSSAWSISRGGGVRPISGIAIASLAGWTLVAASINVIIAYKANFGVADDMCIKERPMEGSGKAEGNDGSDGTFRRPREIYGIFDPPDTLNSTPTPLVLACVAALIAVLLPNPILPLPVVWALIWIRPSGYTYAAVVILMLSLATSIVRLTVGV